MVLNILQHFLVALLIFAPLEALLPRAKGRTFFRRLWWTDIAYTLLASFPIMLGVTFLSAFSDTILGKLIGETARRAISGQPLVLQVAKSSSSPISFITWSTACSTPSRCCGGFIRCITASGKWTGSPRRAFTRSTRY